MGRRATDVNHLAFSVAKVLQKETGTLGQVPTVGCQSGGLRMHVWFKWIKLGLPATYCLKQEVVLLYQDLELRAKRSLSRLASRDFVMSGKFLHFLQSENIGSPDGDPIMTTFISVGPLHELSFRRKHPLNSDNKRKSSQKLSHAVISFISQQTTLPTGMFSQ